MKTAEEWAGWHDDRITADDIKQIQLDAMKEGMRRAANLCKQRSEQCFSPTVASHHKQDEQAILTAAEQLTIKDL